MNCPYCKKEIYALTGLREISKFQKHLKTCKKNPTRISYIDEYGRKKYTNSFVSMVTALEIRAESGQ